MAKVLKAEFFWELYGQGMLNRFNYYSPDSAADPEQLARALAGSGLVNALQNLLPNRVSLIAIAVTDLTGSLGTFTIDMTGTDGRRTGDTKQPFVVWGYQLNPIGTSDFRKGRKAFGGVDETLWNAGNLAGSTAELLVQQVAIQIVRVLTIAGANYIPVLARLNPTGTAWVVGTIVSAAFRRLSTQNSRKEYSGGGPITPTTFDLSVTLSATGFVDTASIAPTLVERDQLPSDKVWGYVDIVPASPPALTSALDPPLGI